MVFRQFCGVLVDPEYHSNIIEQGNNTMITVGPQVVDPIYRQCGERTRHFLRQTRAGNLVVSNFVGTSKSFGPETLSLRSMFHSYMIVCTSSFYCLLSCQLFRLYHALSATLELQHPILVVQTFMLSLFYEM
jgi:hypothetical protein